MVWGSTGNNSGQHRDRQVVDIDSPARKLEGLEGSHDTGGACLQDEGAPQEADEEAV